MPLIRSISGLRATVDDSLTAELISDYMSALNTYLPAGPIVVGRDGRPSGIWIEKVISEKLSDFGREVRILGVVPTPTVQLMVEKSDAVSGIAITASHNPAQWNGMKFINQFGVFFDAEENAKLWKILDSKSFDDTIAQNPGLIKTIDKASEIHINNILNLPIFVNTPLIDKIKSRKLKIVVDAVNASGSKFVPKLLKYFGVDVIELYCDSTGLFPHTPEPLPENLTALAQAVINHKADLGIAVDPDADRLVLIDNNGSPIGEEKTIVLAAATVLSSNEFLDNKYKPIVVVNHSTTRLVEDLASQFEAKVIRSSVGEINVVGKMKASNAVIGGEGSGGVILPHSHYGRDSLVGIALVLALLAKKEKTLSEINDELPRYEMIKNKTPFSGDKKILYDAIKKSFSNSNINEEDGLKIEFDKSWLQIRTSNTEPIIRIISEAPTKLEAINLVNKALDILKNLM